MPFTADELSSLELVFEGAPYVGETTSAIDTSEFDWVFEGAPFVVGEAGGSSALPTLIVCIIS